MKSVTRTTDLKKLKAGNVMFDWGDLRCIHTFGPYDVVEYHPWKRDGVTLITGDSAKDQIEFYSYCDGKTVSISCDSLEVALLHAMARKHDGINSQAGTYAARILNLCQSGS